MARDRCSLRRHRSHNVSSSARRMREKRTRSRARVEFRPNARVHFPPPSPFCVFRFSSFTRHATPPPPRRPVVLLAQRANPHRNAGHRRARADAIIRGGRVLGECRERARWILRKYYWYKCLLGSSLRGTSGIYIYIYI